MAVGEVLSEAFALYRRHFVHFLTIAFVVFAVVALVNLLLVVALGWFGLILSAVVSLVGLYLVQGAVVVAVQDVRDGRADLSLGETLRRVQPRLGILVVTGIVAGIAIAIGFVLLIVPGLILLTWWAVFVPALVLEGLGLSDSLGRSRNLVSGNFWPVLGLIVVVVLILIGASIVLSLILLPLDDNLASFISNFVSNTIFTPFVGLALTLAYYALRAQKGEADAPADTPGGPPETLPADA
jgi:hypothetical protein